MAWAERTQRFLDATTDFAVIHASLDGVVQAWDGAAERVLGFTDAEARGMSLSVLFTPEDRDRGLDRNEIAVAISRGRSEDDRWHVRKDGSRFWASGVLTLVYGDDGQPHALCKVLRDKTDMRTQLEALENQVDSLKTQLESERKSVRSLAHELRNPMMPIVSALALLGRRDATSQMLAKAGEILANQFGMLRRLIEDLSGVAEGATAALDLTLEPVNLSTTLARLVDSVLDEATSRRLRLALVLPDSAIEVAADPSRLQQMLLNLLNNALKYSRDGGRIDVSATIEADMAVVRVEDNGVGIAAEMLPKIFDLFTRENRHADIDGQGVGLAVVKQLATAHGGFVEGRSQGHDKGASFSLRIPIYHASRSPETDARS